MPAAVAPAHERQPALQPLAEPGVGEGKHFVVETKKKQAAFAKFER